MPMRVFSSVGAGITYEQFISNIPLSGHSVSLARKTLLADQDFCDFAATFASPAAEDGETALTLLERATTRFKFRAWLIALKSVGGNVGYYLETALTVIKPLSWPEFLPKKTDEEGKLILESTYEGIFDDESLPENEVVMSFDFHSVFRRALTREGRELEAFLGTRLCTYHEAAYS